MKKQLTRRELYELVWAKPRTELAKQFNISDVAVGKWCRELNVPAPPPGYWAYVASGGRDKKRFTRPPLSFTVAEQIEDDHAQFCASLPEFDPAKFEHPAPSLQMPAESLADALARYKGLINAVPLPKSARGVHPIVQKFLVEDRRLAAKETSYSWDSPKYQGTRGPQLLAGMGRLFWWWTDLGFKPSSTGIRHIRLRVSGGGYGSDSFEITDHGAQSTPRQRGTEQASPAFHLRFDIDERYTRQQSKPALIFSTFDATTLVAITMMYIERREHGFRDWIKREHEHKTWQRGQAIEKDLAAKKAERILLETEHKATLETRERLLRDAIDGIHQATILRGLVQTLEEHVRSVPGHQRRFGAWKAWALAKAQAMDIRTRPATTLDEWISAFRLPDTEVQTSHEHGASSDPHT